MKCMWGAKYLKIKYYEVYLYVVQSNLRLSTEYYEKWV